MTNCLQCDTETTNPKFCNRSCAATFNNKGVRRHGKSPGNCIVCGSRRGKNSSKYCSFGCQQDDAYKMRIIKWLQDGQLSKHGTPNYVRRYLMQEQNGCCAICSISNWNGKLIVFTGDHIDGDSTNNCRSNWRLICPNCDSQTSTYKGRNQGNGRHSRRERYSQGKSY